MRQPTRWARPRPPCGEMGRSPSARFLAKPVFPARLPLSYPGRFARRVRCCDDLREETSPHSLAFHAVGRLSTAVHEPAGPGGTGRLRSAGLVERQAFRPALLLEAHRCDPLRREAGVLTDAFRRCGCCDDLLAPVTAASPDFRSWRRGRSLRDAPHATCPEPSRIAIIIPGARDDDKIKRAGAKKNLVHNKDISAQWTHSSSTMLSTRLRRAALNMLISLEPAFLFHTVSERVVR